MTPSCIFFLRLLIFPGIFFLHLLIFGGPGTLLMEGVYGSKVAIIYIYIYVYTF